VLTETNHTMKVLIHVLIWSTLVTTCYAQDFSGDMMRIRKKYYEPTGEIKFSIRMLFYDVKDLNQVEDSSFGTFRMAKNKSYADFENLISITNDSLVMTLDRMQQKITIGKNLDKNSRSFFTTSIIDSLSKSMKLDVSVIKASSPSNRKYRIRSNEGEVDSVEFEFETSTYLIRSLTLYYSRSIDPEADVKPVVQIIYHDQVISPKAVNEHFDIGKYVVVNNKKATLREKYNSYRLVNNLIF